MFIYSFQIVLTIKMFKYIQIYCTNIMYKYTQVCINIYIHNYAFMFVYSFEVVLTIRISKYIKIFCTNIMYKYTQVYINIYSQLCIYVCMFFSSRAHDQDIAIPDADAPAFDRSSAMINQFPHHLFVYTKKNYHNLFVYKHFQKKCRKKKLHHHQDISQFQMQTHRPLIDHPPR